MALRQCGRRPLQGPCFQPTLAHDITLWARVTRLLFHCDVSTSGRRGARGCLCGRDRSRSFRCRVARKSLGHLSVAFRNPYREPSRELSGTFSEPFGNSSEPHGAFSGLSEPSDDFLEPIEVLLRSLPDSIDRPADGLFSLGRCSVRISCRREWIDGSFSSADTEPCANLRGGDPPNQSKNLSPSALDGLRYYFDLFFCNFPNFAFPRP